METSIDSDIGTLVVSRLTRRLVPFLFVLYIIAYLDRINVGFAALQMQEQLKFNNATYGLGSGMFFAGYLFFQVPSNLVLQRLGARRWIALIMISWGIVSSSMIFVNTPLSFYCLRFLLGVTEAGFFPGMIIYLKNWFPAARQARTIARFMTAGALSGVVGGLVSPALLGVHAFRLAGWQWLFLGEGLPAVLLGAVVAVYLTDHPKDAHWLAEKDRNWLVETLRVEKESHPAASHTSIWTAFAEGNVWYCVLLLVVAYFGANTFAYGISFFLPKVIKSVSVHSNFVIGLLSAIPYVAAAIAMTIAGGHSDRTGERRLHVALPAFAGALAMGAAAYSTSLTVTMVALSIALMGVWSIYGPFWAIPSNLLTGTAAVLGVAVINSLGNLGGLFGPWAIGRLSDKSGGYRGAFLLIGGALALTGFAALLLRVPKVGAARHQIIQD